MNDTSLSKLQKLTILVSISWAEKIYDIYKNNDMKNNKENKMTPLK